MAKTTKKRTTLTKYESGLCKFIIEKFVDPKKINWPRDMKIAKKLIKEYCDFDFWKFVSLQTDLYSLAFFVSVKGKQLLKDRHELYEKQKIDLDKAKPEMSEEKLGEDAKIAPPKSLKDFLTND
mgnify:CR=1 FL=1